MTVTVFYLAQLRRAAGCSSEVIACSDGASLADALRLLSLRKTIEFTQLLFDASNEPRRTWLFFVGDDQATPSTVLREGDQVTILAPMSGGSSEPRSIMAELGIDQWSFEDRLALLQELWQSVSLPADPFPPPSFAAPLSVSPDEIS